MSRNTGNELLAHVAVPVREHVTGVALPGQDCSRCGQKVKPPYYETDVETPLCWQCRKRPCEGYTAFCHECACSGSVVRDRGMCRCGARWSGERVCHCADCHLTFNSIGVFDTHRHSGHCLSETELRARGYAPNEHGRWRKPAPEGTFPGKES